MSQLNIPWSAAALQKTRDPIWIHLEHWPKPEWHGSVRFSDSASSWSSKKRLEGSWDHSFQVTTQSIHETGFRCSISRTLQLAIVVAKKLLSGRNRTIAYLGNAGKSPCCFKKMPNLFRNCDVAKKDHEDWWVSMSLAHKKDVIDHDFRSSKNQKTKSNGTSRWKIIIWFKDIEQLAIVLLLDMTMSANGWYPLKL